MCFALLWNCAGLSMDNTHCIAETMGGPYDGYEYLINLAREKRGEVIQVKGHRHVLEMEYGPDGFPVWQLRYIGMGSNSP